MHPALFAPAPHQHEEKMGFIFGQLPRQLEPEITKFWLSFENFYQLSSLPHPPLLGNSSLSV